MTQRDLTVEKKDNNDLLISAQLVIDQQLKIIAT
jgi:hypothetical protein